MQSYYVVPDHAMDTNIQELSTEGAGVDAKDLLDVKDFFNANNFRGFGTEMAALTYAKKLFKQDYPNEDLYNKFPPVIEVSLKGGVNLPDNHVLSVSELPGAFSKVMGFTYLAGNKNVPQKIDVSLPTPESIDTMLAKNTIQP